MHAAVRQYVDSENILAFADANSKKLRSQIPVVPFDAKPAVLKGLSSIGFGFR
jgi:hypothetical protein